jgi:hypothetical protein
MSISTQDAILRLCALCSSVDTLAVFRCRNWSIPEAGIDSTNLRLLRLINDIDNCSILSSRSD